MPQFELNSCWIYPITLHLILRAHFRKLYAKRLLFLLLLFTPK